MNESNPFRIDGLRPPIRRPRFAVRSRGGAPVIWLATIWLAACATSPDPNDRPAAHNGPAPLDGPTAHDASVHGDHHQHDAGAVPAPARPPVRSVLDPLAPVPPVRHVGSLRPSTPSVESPLDDWRLANDRVRDIGGSHGHTTPEAPGLPGSPSDRVITPAGVQPPAAAPTHEHHHPPAERSPR